jgi:hypothetical protein
MSFCRKFLSQPKIKKINFRKRRGDGPFTFPKIFGMPLCNVTPPKINKHHPQLVSF